MVADTSAGDDLVIIAPLSESLCHYMGLMANYAALCTCKEGRLLKIFGFCTSLIILSDLHWAKSLESKV